ncbi:DUF883 family protein [Dyella silvatica]|uniref:DUF883 family protein n=1 Tax=Dyella silvatica TaxID=2992128 RepID=UPI00224F5715|nr:hypothetical protein [Dyella silvatica]
MSKPNESQLEAHEAGAHARIEEGAVQGTKEAVSRAADQVEEGLHRATDKAAHAATRATEKAADVSERSREAYDEAMDRADVWLDKAREYVREKPVQSVAIALGAGWLLGRILRR